MAEQAHFGTRTKSAEERGPLPARPVSWRRSVVTSQPSELEPRRHDLTGSGGSIVARRTMGLVETALRTPFIFLQAFRVAPKGTQGVFLVGLGHRGAGRCSPRGGLGVEKLSSHFGNLKP